MIQNSIGDTFANTIQNNNQEFHKLIVYILLYLFSINENKAVNWLNIDNFNTNYKQSNQSQKIPISSMLQNLIVKQ